MEKSTSNKPLPSEFTKLFFSNFAVPETEITCIDANASLPEAAKLMRRKHVGSIIVIERTKEGKNVPTGVITDRDLVIETLAQDVTASTLKVSDIMSTNLTTAEENEDLFSMIAKMKENGVNRLPVVDAQGHLVSMVTSKKIVQCLLQGIQDIGATGAEQRRKEREMRH